MLVKVIFYFYGFIFFFKCLMIENGVGEIYELEREFAFFKRIKKTYSPFKTTLGTSKIIRTIVT